MLPYFNSDNLIVERIKEVRQMETTLAVLMVIGIFVGIPVIVGLALAGIHMVAGNWFEKTGHYAEAVTKAHAEIG